MTVEDVILEKLRALSPAKKNEVLQFVSELETADRPSFRSPKGILSDLNFSVSEEDLAEARREMWRGFPRNDIP